MSESVSQNFSPDQVFQEAAAHHQAGRLADAEQLYRTILQTCPGHPDTNHNLGILAAQLGRCDIGLPHFRTALAADPGHAQYRLSTIQALIATAQFPEALHMIQVSRQRGQNSPQLDALHDRLMQAGTPGAEPEQRALNNLVKLGAAQRFAELEVETAALIARYPQSGLLWKMLAVALQSQKKDALAAKSRAAQLLPLDADVHYNLGNALYAAGQVSEAEQSFRRTIQIDPKHIEACGNLGVLLSQSGRIEDAVYCYQQIVQIKPDSARAHIALGGLLSHLGRHQEALLSCQHALSLQEKSVEAMCNLGAALQGLGRHDEAEKIIRRALAIKPDYVEAHINLGNVQTDLGLLADAKVSYHQALALHPDSALAHYNLASILHGERNFAQAETAYRRALHSNPDYINAYTNLGTTLMELGRCEEALSCYIRALSYQPQSPQAICHVGSALHELGRLAESMECYLQVLTIAPDYADAHGNLGGILMQLGKLEEAETYLNRALELDPHDARILTTALIYLPFSPTSVRFAQLDNVYRQRASLPMNVRISFCIAYGKAMESAGHYDQAFEAYEEGNRLHFQDNPFDEAAEDHFMQHTQTILSKACFARFSAAVSEPQHDRRIPIFVVGMQRSGSTLIEQILSSHPAIYGAGELMILGSLAGRADRLIQESTDAAAALAALRALGRQYLDEVWQFAPDARYIIDKMPHNFYYVGLIHLMFPEAKIIHSMRDPVDTCFSGYALRFGAANEFTYDLATLGRYYVRYQKLMQHWHSVLPEGRILDVQYEENVASPEQQARRMLAYLGLPWDPSCLKFHENKRTVRTASVTQVRRPIYATSVMRWKHFEKHLGPLIGILQPESVKGD